MTSWRSKKNLIFGGLKSIFTDLAKGSIFCIDELTHCIWNRLSHTIYWKSPISILGKSSYEIYIFLEKNG